MRPAAGDGKGATARYRRALTLYEALAAVEPPHQDLRVNLADMRQQLEALAARPAMGLVRPPWHVLCARVR